MYVSPIPHPRPLDPLLTRHHLYRTELATNRFRFLAMLDTIAEKAWNTPTARTKWTVGELAVHLYLRLESLPAALHAIRMGTGYLCMPVYMREYVTFWRVRSNAARWTRRTLPAAYQNAWTCAIAALESVGDDEWWLSAEVWGEPGTTVDGLFRDQRQRLFQHLRDVQMACGR